jgi:predicted dehydrogenase
MPVDRRQFLAASLGTLTILRAHPVGAGPNDKLGVAGIGVGGRGGGVLRACDTENVVGICDVDTARATNLLKRYPKAKFCQDYRKMLDAQKDIDAVTVGTPDHTHAVISMAAIKAGKHVYCEKPLTHDVYEARMLAQEAAKAGVTTQMGIQGHSGEGNRMVCEWVWSGALGEVREVDAWCSLSYYPWGHASWSTKWGRRPKDTPACPATLDWDLWIGPAPMRPYHPAYHPRVWRAWWDFGNGMMGDRGAHTLDGIFWALKLGQPTSIDATSMGLNPDTHPLARMVTYEFPARENMPPVKLTWYDGMRSPRPADLEDGRRCGNTQGGAVIKGSKASLMYGVYGEGARIFPEARMKEIGRPPQTIPRVQGSHQQDWVRNAKAGKKSGADFSYSGPLSEICVLGNVATEVDTRIEWDAENMKVTNHDKANQYVRKTYRKGWSL